MKLIKRYADKTKTYSPGRFILELTFIVIIGKILFGLLVFSIASIISDFNINNLPARFKNITSPVFLFFLVCFFAPIFETIIFQWFPIKILQKITSNVVFIVLIDAILFGLAHWGLGSFYMAVMIAPGIVFAWSFILYSDSFLKALWVTASIHGLSNFMALLDRFF